jgi:hypothetical protein
VAFLLFQFFAKTFLFMAINAAFGKIQEWDVITACCNFRVNFEIDVYNHKETIMGSYSSVCMFLRATGGKK